MSFKKEPIPPRVYKGPTLELFGVEKPIQSNNALARIVLGLRAAGINVQFEDNMLQRQIDTHIKMTSFNNDPSFCSPVLIINSWYPQVVPKPQTQVVQDAAKEIGRAGGLARAKNLSNERRSEIATNAAKKRWNK